MRLAFLLAPLLLGPLLPSQDATPVPGAERPGSERPNIEKAFAVPLRDGRLQLGELLRELLAAYELDGGALALPDATIDLRGARAAVVLGVARHALLRTVDFAVAPAGDELVVTIDRERAQQLRRKLRDRVAQLAGALSGEAVAVRPARLELPSPLDPGQPLVVLVHGVESSPRSLAELAAFLHARGCQV